MKAPFKVWHDIKPDLSKLRVFDVDTHVVKTSHHAIFDEVWYLQPHSPPFAQMLFDVGLEFAPNKIPAPPTKSPYPTT
eukprot:CCRYP_007298-RA/>CCRYP_007298-RA protein AED:0.46 eAED:0.46 QI:0/0/0/1/0/0/2/0/77